MSEPRKHHYLPQFYLRGFSANGRSIYQIEKPGGRAYVSSIRDTAAIRDYHELDSPGFEDPNAVEKRLAQVEAQLAEGLARVVQGGIPTPETHSSLMQLVALLRVRVPAFKAHIDTFLQNVVRSMGLMMERKGQVPPIPKGFEDVLRMENLEITISNWKCLELIFRIAADRRLFDILAAMRPTILRAPEGAFFLTCDQPVAVFHPTASRTDAYGVGLADPATEVSVPLSSRVLLFLAWATEPAVDRDATVDEVVEFNRRTVIMADSLVFAPEPSDWGVETAARYRHCSAGMVLDFLDAGSEALHLARFRPIMQQDRYEGPN
ncbi:MAG: DUF4238 domain-containing protein [Candidatus Methylomirabilales bacterium]